jgi:hypothetical protein
MLDTDRAGDGICGLCAARYTLLGDRTEAAGEYTDTVAGEPRSETV